MKRYVLWVCFGLILVMLNSAPASALRRSLEVELETLRKQLDLALEREEKYHKQVEQLDAKVTELLAAKRETQAESGAGLVQLQRDVATLSQQLYEQHKQIEELNMNLILLAKDSALELDQIKERLKALEQANGLVVGPGAGTDIKPGNYKQVYQLAMEQYQAGHKAAALAQFQAFLQAYPQTDLSDNALFMIGEYYFEKGDYEKAIVQYDDVRKKYPQGNKIPNSLLKMALAFDKMGDRDLAKLFLKELITKYPASPEAQIASRQFEQWK